ncbi:MAG: HAMP domain-containing protein [Bdellovibrionales bacterium]|nr:HAMP domain-containing protein [Bdellovibrionales bacterium]
MRSLPRLVNSFPIAGKVLIITVVIVLVSLAGTGLLAFLSIGKNMEILLGQKLEAIAKTAALQIPGETHEEVVQALLSQDAHLTTRPEFLGLQKILQGVKSANGLTSDVYTLIQPEWAPEQMIFVTMSNEKTYSGNSLPMHPIVKDVFKTGLPQYSGMYSDKEGMWVSAFAPIRLQNGKVVSVLEVDYRADQEVAEAKVQLLMQLLIPAFLALLFATLISYFVGNALTRPLHRLVLHAKKVSEGDLNAHTPVLSGDEFGALTEAVNVMTRDLNSSREKVLQAQEELVKAERLSALGELAAGIAHEISNPLAVVLAISDHIEKKLRAQKYQLSDLENDLPKIGRMTNRIIKIIRGLRSFSRDGNNDTFELTQISVLMEDTLTLCNEKIVSHSVGMELSEVPNVQIECRATQIGQVLVNMISNSIDAIETLPEKWIKISLVVSCDEKLQISITDSGPGIPAEVRDKIMEPFFTTKAVGKGTGLGLSITKSIIEGHNGKISIDAHCPNTRFLIELPLRHGQSSFEDGESKAS